VRCREILRDLSQSPLGLDDDIRDVLELSGTAKPEIASSLQERTRDKRPGYARKQQQAKFGINRETRIGERPQAKYRLERSFIEEARLAEDRDVCFREALIRLAGQSPAPKVVGTPSQLDGKCHAATRR
jgi:hypothetical protein